MERALKQGFQGSVPPQGEEIACASAPRAPAVNLCGRFAAKEAMEQGPGHQGRYTWSQLLGVREKCLTDASGQPSTFTEDVAPGCGEEKAGQGFLCLSTIRQGSKRHAWDDFGGSTMKLIKGSVMAMDAEP